MTPGPEWRPTGVEGLTGRLLAMLAVTIGPALLRAVHHRRRCCRAGLPARGPGVSPYRLYALSNAGSLLALLSYPFLVEPMVPRGVQGWGWARGLRPLRRGLRRLRQGRLWTRGHVPPRGGHRPPSAAPRSRRRAPARAGAHAGVAGAERVRVGAAAGDDEPALSGRGGGPVPVGAAAGALPAHLHPRLRARGAVLARGCSPCCSSPRWRASRGCRAQGPHTPLGFQLLAYGGGAVRRLHGVPRRAVPPAARAAPPERLLPLGVRGRSARRPVRQPRGAPGLPRRYAEYPLALAACCLVSLVA